MATEVTAKYTPSLNLSVTVREGRVEKVTTWVTGAVRSTERLVDIPAGKKFTIKR